MTQVQVCMSDSIVSHSVFSPQCGTNKFSHYLKLILSWPQIDCTLKGQIPKSNYKCGTNKFLHYLQLIWSWPKAHCTHGRKGWFVKATTSVVVTNSYYLQLIWSWPKTHCTHDNDNEGRSLKAITSVVVTNSYTTYN